MPEAAVTRWPSAITHQRRIVCEVFAWAMSSERAQFREILDTCANTA